MIADTSIDPVTILVWAIVIILILAIAGFFLRGRL